MTVKVYGIPQCDSIKKTLAHLRQTHQLFEFHDYKKQGIAENLLDTWLKTVPWEILLNRKGTTWRHLPETVKAQVVDAKSAKAVMLDHPSCIKRPIIDNAGHIQVGLPDH